MNTSKIISLLESAIDYASDILISLSVAFGQLKWEKRRAANMFAGNVMTWAIVAKGYDPTITDEEFEQRIREAIGDDIERVMEIRVSMTQAIVWMKPDEDSEPSKVTGVPWRTMNRG